MKITTRICERGMRGLRDNWPTAFLHARMSFSQGLRDRFAGALPFWKLKSHIISRIQCLGAGDFSLESLRPDVRFTVVDLDVDTLVSEKVLNRREDEGMIELSIRQDVTTRVKRATVEISSGDDRRGMIFPVDFTVHSVNRGFRKG